ncbi:MULTISPECIES: ABC transporter substrate-binding protein [Niveibacterium]|uniref:Extracellular solute-binding protein n=1 Tax=Niveibacterium microcysteis TaxID=2811415 RepID=A0ABX7M6U2_9RHOO|nr:MULTISPECIES: extracellular solute-binding protein [Niveibacterium]QSI77231.1 extracellular solute-binding protein [Niveibacterium microcysteis]
MTVTHRLTRIAFGLSFGLAFACAQAATTVTVASFPSFDEAVKAAIPLYKKAHPDVEIKLVSLAFGDHHNAMTTALATGTNLPDVMAVEVGFIGKFAESGGLEDLSKAPYSAMQYQNKFAKFTFPQATGGVGNVAAMPADIGPGALFYRKDLLEKAGISEGDLTKSWDSFLESGKKLKAASGTYLLSNAVDLKDIYIRTGLKDGEGIYFDSKGKVLVNSPRFAKAFELAKAARTAGLDAKIAAWSPEWSEGFKRNQVATQMMGAWLAGHFAQWLAPNTKGNWRSAQLPNGGFASWGGSFYAIPKAAANKKEAWEFIKFMTLNKDMQIEAFRKLDAFPALIEAQNDPFLDQPIEFLGGQKARQLWKVAADKIPAVAVDKFDGTAQDIVNAELDKVLEQNKDIKTALADAQTQIEKRVRRKK